MPFMVIYRTSDGGSQFEQADAIDEAALFVERLRNSEGIDQIRIYRMEEISFAFRPYYKVELGLPERQTAAPTAPAAAEVVAPAESADHQAEPGDDTGRDTEVVLDAPAPVDQDVERPVTAAPSLPPPPSADGEPAGTNGRRGLFGR